MRPPKALSVPDLTVPKGKYESLLHSMNIELDEVTDPKEISMIQDLMESDTLRFNAAFRVTNHKTRKEYDSFLSTRQNKKQVLFWHGSRNENWLSILRTGLELRPANAIISGKMFGYGTYFADRFKKSLGYTSLTGSYWANGTSNVSYLALFDVHVGRQLEILQHHSWCSSLNETSLKKYGDYDSVFAKSSPGFLYNNEFIVYHQGQSTIKYLVEIVK